jgi:SepF-like predicted cell division protein (DUF552 family)
MTYWKIGTICASILLLPASPLQADDVKAEVVVRCIHDMGEWGNEMIKRCVEGDLAAAEALQAYPEEHRRIVDRCTKRMQRRGWEMVKLCADKDIAAEDALARYPAEHQAVIDDCREEAGRRGADRVKTCVDRRIGAGASPDSD